MADRIALVVDDAPANRDFLERLIEQANLKVVGAGSGRAALDAVSAQDNVVLALVDMKLPDMTGLQLLAEIRQRFPLACLVIATMLDDRALIDEAFNAGCHVFLVKPHGFMDLFRRLTTEDISVLRDGPRLIIDQYGQRKFKTQTQEVIRVKPDPDPPA